MTTSDPGHGNRVTRVTCTHDCPDACAMLMTVRDGRGVDVAPQPPPPVTRPHHGGISSVSRTPTAC
jgi:hypothetical protein